MATLDSMVFMQGKCATKRLTFGNDICTNYTGCFAVCEEYVRSNRSELFVRTKYPENNELSDVKNMDLGSSLGWIMGGGWWWDNGN